jgi:NTE family protein
LTLSTSLNFIQFSACYNEIMSNCCLPPWSVPVIILLVGINLLPIGLAAENSAPSTRPQIGVALSGGGARGFAHIGVLEALEDLNIPIDYIAGTSMGSIIGGLYASGLTTQELRRAVEHEIDWNRALNYTDDRDLLSYREKQTQRRLFQLELGIDNKGLTASAGFINGQELFMELKRLTRNINIDDFAKLPIPFKTVATDLNTAEPYLLAKGDLALALRASMAVPFAFAPVEIDGHLLADGGIVNNIPVDIVRKMGADIVIAIDISAPLETIESTSSFLTVTKQSLNVSLIQNALRSLKKADIVITPEVKEFGVTDFYKGPGLMANGYEAIMEKVALLKTLALSTEEYAQYTAAKRAKIPDTPATIKPDFIELTGNERTHPALLQGKLEGLKNRELRFEDIKHATKDLMTLKEFEQVTYQVTPNSQGKSDLVFNITEKPWGPDYFRLGLNLSTSFDDKTDFLVLLRHEKLNVNRLGAEWVNEVEFGTGFSLFSEFYQPLDYQRHFFVAPYAKVEHRFVDVFEQQQSVAEYDLKGSQIGLDLGINLGNRAMFRSGIVYDQANTSLRLGKIVAESTNGDTQENSLTFQFGYDSLDARVFAKSGMRIDLDGRIYYTGIGSDFNYQKAKLYTRQHFPVHRRATLVSELTIATVFNSDPPEYEGFSVGGFDLLAGYPNRNIGGNHALLFRLGGLFNPPGIPKLGSIDARLIGLLHVGNAWDDYSDIRLADLHYGGLAGVVWETQFGSILVGVGYTDGGSLRYNLSLGHFF